MADIKMTQQVPESELEKLEVRDWPIWTKETSTFAWSYDEEETCYFLEGEVTVTPEGGQPVRFGKGDLVTFPAGMTCTWEVKQPVRKHFRFG
ncbi:MAG: cupin domain-containing protein [Magnetococcales bacterium]|nr:cupin domain-containing protein [Magnetococcales bacterium]